MKCLFTFILSLLSFEAAYSSPQAPHFQIGEHFERTFHKNLDGIPSQLHNAALSVAQFGRSTSFYIGRHNEKDLMVTTAHSALSEAKYLNYNLNHYKKNPSLLCKIFIEAEDSEIKTFDFALLHESFECQRLIAIYPEFDLAFFEIKKRPDLDISHLGVSFSNPVEVKRGEPLVFFSLSGYKNPGYITFDLGMTTGNLCTSFADSTQENSLESFDDLNGKPLSIPSLPIGCDVSPGDSGSPLLNQKGELVGILWAALGGEKSQAKSDTFLTELVSKKDDYSESDLHFIWNNLNYASSLSVILEKLKEENCCENVACKNNSISD